MKFYITTPIYYVTDRPHIGNAYTTLAADTLARYHRFIGDDVLYLTGTDEHGAKVAEAAASSSQAPHVFADEVSQQFKTAWKALGISYDRFIRTTDADHVSTVEQFLQMLYDHHFIYKGEYEGLYCKGCEEFKKPAELIDGVCPLHGTVPEAVHEPAYFFKLSAFQTELIKLVASDELQVRPETRKNEVLGFLEHETLEDIAMSRQNVAWGIPLPWDKSHTCYVWVDALINYYTARDDFWPPTWHLLGKDILRFHSVIWPAMLLAARLELPKGIFVHGFFTVDGQKMSKTLKNGIDPLELIKTYSPDTVRFFLFRGFPFGNDGDFSYSLLDEVHNGALSNELGNLVQRVLVMVQKYRGGVVPRISSRASNIETAVVASSWGRWSEALDALRLDEAYKAVWELVRFANQRIDEMRPWDLAKSGPNGNESTPGQLSEILYELVEMVRHIALQLTPLMPGTAERILQSIGQEFREIQSAAQFTQRAEWGGTVAGTKVHVGQVLFPRRDIQKGA